MFSICISLTRGATAVRFVSAAETVSDGEASAKFCRACYLDHRTVSLRAVHGSASVRDGVLCVTAVNTHPTEPLEMELDIHSGKLTEAEVVTLSADTIHAHNTFARPDAVTLSAPARIAAQKGDALRVTLPPPASCVLWARFRRGKEDAPPAPNFGGSEMAPTPPPPRCGRGGKKKRQPPFLNPQTWGARSHLCEPGVKPSVRWKGNASMTAARTFGINGQRALLSFALLLLAFTGAGSRRKERRLR